MICSADRHLPYSSWIYSSRHEQGERTQEKGGHSYILLWHLYDRCIVVKLSGVTTRCYSYRSNPNG